MRRYGITADYLLAGGRRRNERLFCRLARLGEDIEAGAVEGTDDGYHVRIVGQLRAQRFEIAGKLVVPVEVKAYTNLAGELCLLEVVEEPLGGALQLCLGDGVAVRIDHRNLLIHPRMLRLNDNLVVFLGAGSKQHHACCAQPHHPSDL